MGGGTLEHNITMGLVVQEAKCGGIRDNTALGSLTSLLHHSIDNCGILGTVGGSGVCRLLAARAVGAFRCAHTHLED